MTNSASLLTSGDRMGRTLSVTNPSIVNIRERTRSRSPPRDASLRSSPRSARRTNSVGLIGKDAYNYEQYAKYEESPSCFLDGRYFNKVLSFYKGLVKDPLKIKIKVKNGGLSVGVHVHNLEKLVTGNEVKVLRVVIKYKQKGKDDDGVKGVKHCNLLIIDPVEKKLWRFDPMPIGGNAGGNKYNELVSNAIKSAVSSVIGYEYNEVRLDNVEQAPEYCKAGGFCNAYVLKYALDYINGKQYNPSDIRRFMAWVEKNYTLPEGSVEDEYSTDGALLGGLLGGTTGAVLGGIAGGPVGFLGGAALGGLGGATLGGLASGPNQYYY
ncbi:Hypothetical protein ORPV_921 [Orpheovirus IHUMI-LCC2]|uniref:Uncharacterized protein n=1 Tax=Orpheovirus IHUMI-LCC2 TaxID=2023057 RepID=A0A2I2L5J5_9VIRU|nr:Hypothetical protein ORPV_921 [Orpheovirus IHUMI-LCC2]SNW62825.1 Hypothetical protein ORPV_921 [Orpheovirus IHUMI-LCC2]